MKFYLIVAKGKKQGQPIPIEVDLFMIGGGKMCQLRAVHDDIGEKHCALLIRGKKVFVSDLDSGHKTIVNEDALEPGIEWPLHNGDRIEIGPLKFIVQFREKALSQRDLEEWALSCLDQRGERKVIADSPDSSGSAPGNSADYESAAGAAGAILDGLNALKGEVKGRLRISKEAGITILRVNDIYLVEESELALIRKEMQDHCHNPSMRILVDMKNVKRMSSAAAEMFSRLREWLAPFGSKIAFCRLRGEFEGMLKTYPGTQGLPLFPDKPKALAAKW